MKIVVSTHQGKLYDEEIDYVVVHTREGEFAILKDHIPVISVINEGYVKMVNSEVDVFIVIYKGLLEFHNNVVNVLAQEAHAGRDLKEAYSTMEHLREERRESNRKETTDFTKMEKDLRDNLKKANAGDLK